MSKRPRRLFRVRCTNVFAARVRGVDGPSRCDGQFGADMQVALINDGPVTIWIDSKNKE